MSRPVGGILSGPPASGGGLGGHPSERPTWGAPSFEGRTSSPSPTLGLAPGGVYRAGGVTPDRWCALTAPFHPYLCEPGGPPSAVSFLWHCPAGHPDWPLASTLLCGVPTFLDTVPQTVRAAATWPTHRRRPVCHRRPGPVAQHLGRVGLDVRRRPPALRPRGHPWPAGSPAGLNEEAPCRTAGSDRLRAPGGAVAAADAGPGPAAPVRPRESPAAGRVRPGAPSGHPSRCPLHRGSLRAGRGRAWPGPSRATGRSGSAVRSSISPTTARATSTWT